MAAFGAIADLIHRKRSPFPYEGKALTPLKLGQDCECWVLVY